MCAYDCTPVRIYIATYIGIKNTIRMLISLQHYDIHHISPHTIVLATEYSTWYVVSSIVTKGSTIWIYDMDLLYCSMI